MAATKWKYIYLYKNSIKLFRATYYHVLFNYTYIYMVYITTYNTIKLKFKVFEAGNLSFLRIGFGKRK